MPSPPQFSRKVRFGEFELSVDTAELRNNGTSIVLPFQPYKILLALLDRPGEMVTRDELKKKLWTADTFVDFDQSLNKAVNRLRDALGDSAEHPRFIETLPKRGYRFVGSVESTEGPIHQAKGNGHRPSPQEIEASTPDATRSARVGFSRFTVWTPVVLILATVGLGVARWMKRPLPVPHVSGMVRITNDGWRKFALISDGVRLYFSERGRIFQSSTGGGESTELHTGLTELDIYDISPAGSELLVASGVAGSETDERPIWVVSLPAGAARRVGEIKGLWACWAPDMEHLAYATRSAIYLAKRDGTEIRKLRDIPVVPWKIQFSPDGSRLRFDGYDAERNVDSIWEMSADGQKLSSLFPSWHTPLHTGNWTNDGRYFVFNTHDPAKDLDEDIWLLPEPGGSGNSRTSPVQLTKGPLAFGYPIPSADGKKLFVLGTQSVAELARYDSREKQFVPYLAGISAVETEVSRDGKWVAYISYPDLSLWRSRVDGNERVQLTFPPAEVIGPRWSPDDTRIAFTDVQPGRAWKISTISAGGGAPEEILPGDTLAEIDGSWWPDGESIIFGRSYFAGKGGIQRVDLRTHRVLTVPGSEKVFSPRLSPDGTKIAAFREQGTVLMLYDFSEGHWRDVAHGMFQFNIWSRDGNSIYLLDMKRGDEIMRFDVSRAKFEDVATLRNIEQGNRGWVGLARDDSPLIVRDKSITDIYRLDLQLP